MFLKFVLKDHYMMFAEHVNLISFSYTELENDPSLIHSHPHTEIIVPQNEAGNIVCGSQTYASKPQRLFIVPPNISHTETNINKNEAFKYFVVKIQNTIIKEDLSNEEIIILTPPGALFNELNTYLKTAKNHLSSNSVNENIVTLNSLCFYYALTDYLQDLGYVISSKNVASYSSVVQETQYYIAKNYSEDINIKELAHRYGISRSSLDKKFLKELGTTPKEYLIKKRLETARYLLQTTDFTVSQISSVCGFVSPAYFTYVFKKDTNATPTDFRKKK